jgi:carbonyl reductase 1
MDEGFAVTDSSDEFVVVVTGANKGIGLALVKTLSKLLPRDTATVILTARNIASGEAAADVLLEQGITPLVHQLDITDENSVEEFKSFLQENFPGQLKAIINNAGFAYTMAATEAFGVQARKTLDINYYGTKRVIDALLPLMRPGGRIICVSSRAGSLRKRRKTALGKRLLAPKLKVDELSALMEEFAAAAAEGKHKEQGWPNSAYGVSKTGVTQLCRVYGNIQGVKPKEAILFTSCCPGFVRTEMTGGRRTSMTSWMMWLAGVLVAKTPAQGADTPAFLAVSEPLKYAIYQGKFVAERQRQPY